MTKFLIALFIFPLQILHSQYPDWGTLTVLDHAELIVIAVMHVEDSVEGLGILEVTHVLKGDKDITDAKVRFSDRHEKDGHTKHEDPPEYFYYEGQTGIWLLTQPTGEENRYNLRGAELYYRTEWEGWISGKLDLLDGREWKRCHGLSGSVIIDSIGNNKLYRFFYLSLRNDSETTLYINTHYRIREPGQQRIRAHVITPENEKIDLLTGGSENCRLSGEPGWPIPDMRDFRELQPGGKIYLLASGSLRCFYTDPLPGNYLFQASYANYFIPEGFEGKVWTGELIFPEEIFFY